MRATTNDTGTVNHLDAGDKQSMWALDMRVEQYWSHSYIPSLIRADAVAFDIGVNSGGFARILASRCKRVICFEPDPEWLGKLHLPANVELHPLAISGQPGKLKFHVNVEKCSSLHFSDEDAKTVEVDSITLEDALALAPREAIDLIKIDIEGEELNVLSGAPKELFARVAQMTIEFHDFLDPESLPKIKSVVAQLRSYGFIAIKFSWRSHGDYLFINRTLIQFSLLQQIWIIARYKYIRGIVRIVRRILGSTT